MSPEQLKQVALELAMVGKQGLDLKDTTPKHILKALPGAFSGIKIITLAAHPCANFIMNRYILELCLLSERD